MFVALMVDWVVGYCQFGRPHFAFRRMLQHGGDTILWKGSGDEYSSADQKVKLGWIADSFTIGKRDGAERHGVW